ncbi:MAG TPA: PIN domain-containing protein, partial [Burkholderiaceae bacterium]|nr:PIN domain-containing protein [Burkholderiaceae bacterium]
MRKNFVLDTNVLLHDPRAMFHFVDNTVIIPIYVLEEIDHFKKELSERGRNAREVARRLDEYRAHGNLAEGVSLEQGGTLRVELGKRNLPEPLKASQIVDNYILGVALEVRDRDLSIPTFLVTKDVNLRIRADSLGLKADDYLAEAIDVEELYSGNGELEVPGAQIDEFYQAGTVSVEGLNGAASHLYANQYLLLRDRDNSSHTALGRYDGVSKRVAQIKKLREGVWGIRPRNKEQHYAMDLLLNDD